MIQKSLTKNSIYNVIYTIINILFPFVTSIYVSRILLPSGVGKVASAQNITSYFVTIAALGLPSYGVREFAKIREEKQKRNKLFTELMLLNIASTTLAVILFFLLLFVNRGFNGEWALYVVCGISIVFNYLNIDWMYRGLEEYGYITGRSLFIKVLSLLVLLLFVKTRQDYVVYALISSVATGGNYIFNVIHAKKIVSIDLSEIELKHHVKSILIIAVVVFLSSIYNKIDVTMLNFLGNDESVGYYAYAQKTVSMVLTLANAITASLLPRLSFYYDNNKQSFYELLDRGFQVLCFMIFPLSVGMMLVAHQAVILLYGEAFAPTILTIRLMCPLILIKGFGDLFCYQLVYSTKSEKIILPASASASIINIIANALLIPVLLHNGAVVASVFSELVTNAIQFIYMKKKVQFKLNYKALTRSLFSTVLMAMFVLIIMYLRLPNTIGFLAEVVCGIVVYIAVNLAMKNEVMYDFIEKIKGNLLNRG